MNNTDSLTALIDQTTTTILDEWTAEAASAGIDTDSYIGDKLDAMEDTNPDVCQAVGAMHLRRMFVA